MAITSEQRAAKRRQVIAHRLRKQEFLAAEFEKLPPEVRRRKIRRHGRSKAKLHIDSYIKGINIPPSSPLPSSVISDIDVLMLVRLQDYSNATYLLAEALKSVGVKAVALLQQKPRGIYPRTGEVVQTVIEIRKYALRAKIIQFMHSNFIQVPLEGKHVVVYHGGTRYRQKSASLNKFFNPMVDKSIIQTRDLWDLGAKNQVWILPPVDTNELKPDFSPSGDKRVIAHYPHKGKYKGSEPINGVITKLVEDSELKDKFEYRHQNMTSAEPWLSYLKRISDCDIYIEACAPTQNEARYGEWGITALEAAALGKVVVTHFLNQDEYAYEYGPCPLMVANSAGEMEEVLRKLILMDENELLDLKVRTRAWVEEYHSFEAVGKRLKEKVYGDWL